MDATILLYITWTCLLTFLVSISAAAIIEVFCFYRDTYHQTDHFWFLAGVAILIGLVIGGISPNYVTSQEIIEPEIVKTSTHLIATYKEDYDIKSSHFFMNEVDSIKVVRVINYNFMKQEVSSNIYVREDRD